MMKAIKVLLVDDEERFRITAAKILGHKGMQSMTAANGKEALERLTDHPDVVVLDICMPGMDGEATLAAIKERKPHLPVIMLTGHGEQTSAERAMALGASDYLTKPADLDLLGCKIFEAVRKSDTAGIGQECRVADLMRPLNRCAVVGPESPIREVFLRWREIGASAGEQGRSDDQVDVLVGKGEEIVGLVSAGELLGAVRPDYLADHHFREQSTGTTWRYSHMFWNGLFTHRLEEILAEPVAGIMTLPPPPIASDATLMAACDLMRETSARCLLVMAGGAVVGLLEEWALVAEMARVVAAGEKT